VLFVLPLGGAVDPDHHFRALHAQSEWGVINQLIFSLTAEDGPNWLNDPVLALVAVDGRAYLEIAAVLDPDSCSQDGLAIPHELYEAASVDGAGAWHRFRFITWPSMTRCTRPARCSR